ncbi:MAG TPA: 50S ribosomal protein L32 [Chloroflexota bacterium]|nr:50S ribosomal protein L32 [Chloroflexota bacterium]
MPPLPKRRTAKARQGERRQHLRVATPTLVECPRCSHLRPSHQVCPNCGTYKGEDVLKKK